MVYLQIEEDRIPIGNFSFVYDHTKNEELFGKFYEAEKNLKVDYMDFAHKTRMAFEAFALDEEARKRKQQEEYSDMNISAIKEQIIAEIKQPASVINYKNIIIDLCSGRELEFAEMLLKYSFIKTTAYEDDVRRKLKAFIRFLYGFGSESSHENVSSEEKYLPNRENCLRVVGSFHDFLCVYYGKAKKYDSTLAPIRDYIAVPKPIVEKMGLVLETGKSLFVKERRGKIAYYIFSSDIDSISQGQRRDIDIIHKLWEDNFEDPSNVIRQTENITGSNGDYKFKFILYQIDQFVFLRNLLIALIWNRKWILLLDCVEELSQYIIMILRCIIGILILMLSIFLTLEESISRCWRSLIVQRIQQMLHLLYSRMLRKKSVIRIQISFLLQKY